MKRFAIVIVFFTLLLTISSADSFKTTSKCPVQESTTSSKVLYMYDSGVTVDYESKTGRYFLVKIPNGSKGYVYDSFTDKKSETLNTSTGQYTAPSVYGQSLTKKAAGQIVADFAYRIITKNKKEFIYSCGNGDMTKAYRTNNASCNGVKTSGIAYGTSSYPANVKYTNKFAVDCSGFCCFCYRHALKVGKGYGSFAGYGIGGIGSKKLSDCQPGDIISQPGHYMLYIGKLNGKYVIGEAMNGSVMGIRTQAKSGSNVYSVYRLNNNAVANLDYNKAMSSIDLNHKLDTKAPKISSATVSSGKLTFTATDSVGVVGWAFTTNKTAPTTTWNIVSMSTSLSQTVDVPESSKYFWILDAGGNTASKEI